MLFSKISTYTKNFFVYIIMVSLILFNSGFIFAVADSYKNEDPISASNLIVTRQDNNTVINDIYKGNDQKSQDNNSTVMTEVLHQY